MKGVQIARMEQLVDMYMYFESVLPASMSPSEASPKDRDMLWDTVCKVGNHVSSAAEKEKMCYVLQEHSDAFLSPFNDRLGYTSLSKHKINRFRICA